MNFKETVASLFPHAERLHVELECCLEAICNAIWVCEKVWGDQSQGTVAKADTSPVTVADYAAQFIITEAIYSRFPNDLIIAEEDFGSLSPEQSQALTRYGIELGQRAVDRRRITDVDVADCARFWVVDPIDGTLGYIQGGQYACCVGLIEDGQVMVSCLGCPRLSPGGAIFVAARSYGAFMIQGIDGETKIRKLPLSMEAFPLTLCESREKSHTNHSFSKDLAQRVQIHETIPMDSQCKYGLVAQRKAHIYLRHSVRKDYKEKIWDHAPGALLVEEAGGQVTDFSGSPIHFGVASSIIHVTGGIVATNMRSGDALTHEQLLLKL